MTSPAMSISRMLPLLVRSRMRPDARLFLSASGLDSELGEGYTAGRTPVVDRFAPLADVRVDGPVEREVFREHVHEHERVVHVGADDRFLGASLDAKGLDSWFGAAFVMLTGIGPASKKARPRPARSPCCSATRVSPTITGSSIVRR